MNNYSYSDIYKDVVAGTRKSRVGTILPTDMVTLYNAALSEVITNKVSILEGNKRIISDLIHLKINLNNVEANINTDETVFAPVYSYTIADKVRRIMKVSTIIESGSTIIGPIKTVIIKSNEGNDIMIGSFSKPSIHQVYYTLQAGKENVIDVYLPKNISITKVKLYIEYYKEPTLVTVTDIVKSDVYPPFTKELCDEIVNTCIRMYLHQSQDNAYNTFNHELNKKNTKN